jgi:hypothetical protein
MSASPVSDTLAAAARHRRRPNQRLFFLAEDVGAIAEAVLHS